MMRSMSSEQNRLYRSRDDRMLMGVLGGVANRLNADPSLVRIVYIILTILTGFVPLAFLYVIAAFVVPAAPRDNPADAAPGPD
jgi:phage shock protein PspC (stress-responsive transcriptional regulator)